MIEKNDPGFLSRWSRQKLTDKEPIEKKIKGSESLDLKHKPEQEVYSEADEQLLPLWQQKDVEPDMKRKALSALFKQPEFNDVDHMNEYDEDFTHFSSLGDVVTEEMKRMLRLAEEKTRSEADDSLSENEPLITHKSNDEDVKPENDEEDKLA